MDIAPFVPIIAEATKFMFGEISTWIEHVRQKSGKSSNFTEIKVQENNTAVLTQQDFKALQSDMLSLASGINSQIAEANAYTISGLVDQLKIHHKNLVDLETTESEYGTLTPQHVKRGIEREVLAIVEKSTRLKQLLEQVHGKRIELP